VIVGSRPNRLFFLLVVFVPLFLFLFFVLFVFVVVPVIRT
jgi:hypothetical protein